MKFMIIITATSIAKKVYFAIIGIKTDSERYVLHLATENVREKMRQTTLLCGKGTLFVRTKSVCTDGREVEAFLKNCS